MLEGEKLACEYSWVWRHACESLHKVICNLNNLSPLKTVPHVCAARSAGGLVPHPRKPLLRRVWQEGHAEWQPYEIACALYKYLNPSTLSPLQRIRKGAAVSGFAYSKETCLWAGGQRLFPPVELMELSGIAFCTTPRGTFEFLVVSCCPIVWPQVD